MKWFRFYDEVLDDPKCQRLSPVLFKHWVNVLCIASRSSERGTLPPIADIAFGLRVSPGQANKIVGQLVDATLIDREGETLRMHGWSVRQRATDNVAERVAKHRSRNRDETLRDGKSNVTNPLPHVRATETETERDTPPEGPPLGADAPPAGDPPRVANSRRKPEQPLPTDLACTGDVLAYGVANGLSETQTRHEFAKFTKHALATDRRLRDWSAGWQQWVLKSLDYGADRSPGPGAARSANGANPNVVRRLSTADLVAGAQEDPA
jgi:hypothetical protein